MDIYMIKSLPGEHFLPQRKDLTLHMLYIVKKTDVKRNEWLKSLEPVGHEYGD